MTSTSQQIADRIRTHIESDAEVATLGYLAASCELMAAGSRVTKRERRELEARAEQYRELQLKALEKRTGK